MTCDDVVQSEVFVFEAGWSLILLFWVGLDVEELRTHRVHLVLLKRLPTMRSQRVVGRDFSGVEEGTNTKEVGIGSLTFCLLLRLLQFALSSCQQFRLLDHLRLLWLRFSEEGGSWPAGDSREEIVEHCLSLR